ncbi:MAG: hypothetical protein H6741_11010 [Alphaproteobacteria bacterium]|nr:hypothetical protein [Alphaproteobacteria bacterium]
MLLFSALLGATLAQDVQPDPTPTRERGARFYGASGATLLDGQPGRVAAAVGGATLTRGARFSGIFGAELAFGDTGHGLLLPILSADAGLRWSPRPSAWLRPFANAGVGASLVPVSVVPSANLGVGAEMPLTAGLIVDAELNVRTLYGTWYDHSFVTFPSLRLGLGF